MTPLAVTRHGGAYLTGLLLPLTLASLLAARIPGFGAEPTTRPPELTERESFIRYAMQEFREQLERKEFEQSIQPVLLGKIGTLVPFADWDFYCVNDGTILWLPDLGNRFDPVIVPSGFVTDLTSIPRAYWQMLRPEGRLAYAALVHDYLYWAQTRPRDEADRILRIAMKDFKVQPETVETISEMVRLFGQSAWDNNARLKHAGERRILKRCPEDFGVSWSDWKKRPDVFWE